MSNSTKLAIERLLRVVAARNRAGDVFTQPAQFVAGEAVHELCEVQGREGHRYAGWRPGGHSGQPSSEQRVIARASGTGTGSSASASVITPE